MQHLVTGVHGNGSLRRGLRLHVQTRMFMLRLIARVNKDLRVTRNIFTRDV